MSRQPFDPSQFAQDTLTDIDDADLCLLAYTALVEMALRGLMDTATCLRVARTASDLIEKRLANNA